MAPTRRETLEAALRLRSHIADEYLRDGVLVGLDPIGKIDWRITRFLRNFFGQAVPGGRHVFFQGIAYWCIANLRLGALLSLPEATQSGLQTADAICNWQHRDGYWPYPNIVFRRNKIATVEGSWAAIALCRAFRTTEDSKYLEAAIAWHRAMESLIGYAEVDELVCVNYYQDPIGMIPNNATLALWLNAELESLTGDAGFSRSTPGQLRFLVRAQLESGELPYAWRQRDHLYCYQYNSFEYLDLLEFQELSRSVELDSPLRALARYLGGGVLDSGACKRDCFRRLPEVHYWTLALSLALRRASVAGHVDALDASDRALKRVLGLQRTDGAFEFSAGEYGFLRDRNRYPRYLAMMLDHFVQSASMLP